MEITKESNKMYFNPGDIVYFKGTEEFEQYPMKVQKIVFEKNEDGEYIKNEKGGKVPRGILVLFFPEYHLGGQISKGEPIEKVVDSRSIYKKEYKPVYYLQEVKKIFISQNRVELVEEINNILNKL
jgi:hypothetical protein